MSEIQNVKEPMHKFIFDHWFEEIVECSIDFSRTLVKLPFIHPAQIIGIAKALYALERLPEITVGIHVEFGILKYFLMMIQVT